ncbi:hypothetical protein Hanom_Chr00s001777g01687581 [Helianthus anomalus]
MGERRLTTDKSGPCLYLSWNENVKGFMSSSPGPLMKPLNLYQKKNGILSELKRFQSLNISYIFMSRIY